MPFGIQPIHIVFIVIVALIVFGPKRLPEVGRWVGRTLSEFRTGAKELTEAIKEEAAKTPETTNSAQAAPPEPQSNTIAPPGVHSSIPVDAKFCTRCGSPNAKDALFCNKCGNQLSA